MEWFVARRYLISKPIALFSALGVFLGSFVLIIALSVANGFEKEVRDRIVGTLAHAKIIQFHSRPITNPDSLEAQILKHPEVLSVSPFISGKGGVEYDRVQEGVIIMGIDAHKEKNVTEMSNSIVYGEFNLDSLRSKRDRKLPTVMIGIGLANKLGVREGNEIVLMALAEVSGALEPTPRMERYAISGIFETGMYEYDLNLVYISIHSAQKLLGQVGVEGIQMKTKNMYHADKVGKEVVELLDGYPYRSTDWKSQNRSLFEWMKLEKIIIFIVINCITLVASFNIISSLIMMILEKRREIGILMSMGARSGMIMKIFLFNGMIIGIVGSTIGTSLGLLLCWIQYRYHLIPLPGDIYFINMVPVLIRWFDIALVFLAANLICLLITLYPAWRASKVLPAQSLRYE